MEKKSQEFSMDDALRLARSPAARQLVDTLRTKDPAALDHAMDHVAAGDYEQARKQLQTLLSDPAVLALLRQLGG